MGQNFLVGDCAVILRRFHNPVQIKTAAFPMKPQVQDMEKQSKPAYRIRRSGSPLPGLH